jgi:hypothetical protein
MSSPAYGSVLHGRPAFASRIKNVTVNVGREAVLECPVDNLGKYKVGEMMMKGEKNKIDVKNDRISATQTFCNTDCETHMCHTAAFDTHMCNLILY